MTEKLIIEVYGGINSGKYECELMETLENSVKVRMPQVEGRMIALPAGQPIRVRYLGDKEYVYDTEIIERIFTPEAALIIPKPGSITRIGRNVPQAGCRVITITSGKGGVGKTNICVSLAIALNEAGKKCIVLDADMGLANIDVIAGIKPQYDLTHLLSGDMPIDQVVTQAPNGFSFIAGGAGLQELADLGDWQLAKLVNSLSAIEDEYDFIIIDTGAGIASNVISFVLAADEVILILTPEPTSMADAYALIKVLSGRTKEKKVSLLVNRAETLAEANMVAAKISMVSEKFLGFRVEKLGYIPDDINVSRSVKKQVPFVIGAPRCEAAKSIRYIAKKMCDPNIEQQAGDGIKSFIKRLAGFLSGS